MSSWLLLALALALGADQPASEPVVTAEEAMAVYRDTFVATASPRCPPQQRPDEIVVCGRRPDQRLPLPVGREPGEPVRMLPGESPRADAGRTEGYCFSRCPGTVGIDLNMAIKIGDGIRRALEGDD